MSNVIYYRYAKYCAVGGFKPGTKNKDPVIKVRESYDGVPVTMVLPNSFQDHDELLAVELPPSVVEIGENAFRNCRNLSNITVTGMNYGELPFRSVGDHAFDATAIDGHVNFTADTLELGRYCFHDSGLDHVTISGTNVTLGEGCFSECPIKTFTCVNERHLTIPAKCFEGCRELASALVPGVQRVGSRGFGDCVSLRGYPSKVPIASCKDSFEGTMITPPPVPKPRRKKEDKEAWKEDTLVELDVKEIMDAVEKESSTCEKPRPILWLKLNSKLELPRHIFPPVHGAFSKASTEAGLSFIPAGETALKDVDIDLEFDATLLPVINFLAAGAIPVRLQGSYKRQNCTYEVTRIVPAFKADNPVSRELFDEIVYRLTGSYYGMGSSDHLVHACDARAYLLVMQDVLPDFVVSHIRQALRKLDKITVKENIQHCVTCLEYWLNMDFSDTPVSIPDKRAVRSTLDQELGALEDVKDEFCRIADTIRHLQKINATPILLVGPPGTGKTSWAYAFAKAINQPLVRIDMSTIDGRNRDYLTGSYQMYTNGIMGYFARVFYPFRRMEGVLQVDEIEKADSGMQELFLGYLSGQTHDSFLEADLPTDRVLTILTSNDISKVIPPLRDRCQIICLPGYTFEEQRNILRNYILPNTHRKYKIAPGFSFTEHAEKLILRDYCSGSGQGVRQLKAIAQKFARHWISECSDHPESADVRRVYGCEDVKKVLGLGNQVSRTIDVHPGLVRFAYLDTEGNPRLGQIQVSIRKGSGKLEILGTNELCREHIQAAYIAVRNTAPKANLDALDTTVFLPDRLDTYNNVVGLPVYLGVFSALWIKNVDPGKVVLGCGIDLYGNAFLSTSQELTSVMKMIADHHNIQTVCGPTGYTDRVGGQLTVTPIMLESHKGEELVKLMLASSHK